MAWINFTGKHPSLLCFPVLAGIALFSLNLNGQAIPELSDDEIAWIGSRVFTNECNRKPACLTAWNQGEAFPSLGIGHFIWYRRDQAEIFEQSFPALMQFMEQRGVAIPAWVKAENYAAPWPDRETFLAETDGPRLVELRAFLAATMPEQTAFIIARVKAALDGILASTDDARVAADIERNFNAVAAGAPPYGLYALIDYVNFKGTGVSSRETYRGQGWGLKQVLMDMNATYSGTGNNADALDAFVASARRILENRVRNAPADRNESRWLAGWHNRLDTYLPVAAGALSTEAAGATPTEAARAFSPAR